MITTILLVVFGLGYLIAGAALVAKMRADAAAEPLERAVERGE